MDPPAYTLLILFLSTNVAFSADNLCHDTLIKVDKQTFNLNHLKDHLPPNQEYSDLSNIYAESANSKLYTFFNLGDIVRSQSSAVQGRPVIKERCKPTSNGPSSITSRPAACIEEPDQKNCDPGEKYCWIPIADCQSMVPSVMDNNNGINILYSNTVTVEEDTFLVSINCCQNGPCLEKLSTPVTLKTSNCPLNAKYCVEMDSPYGCNCATRAQLDQQLGKKEFHCDATPSGLGSSISTGSLLLIFFFIGGGMYLGIGMGYNYNEGRRGQEMIPHLDMWKDLGGLIYDGFMFVKSCGEYREGVQYDTIG